MLTVRQLGLDGLFEDAFDIVAAGLTSKPAEAAYTAFFERCQVDPQSAAMFEDMAKNLAVPKAKGMTTTLVTTKRGCQDQPEPSDKGSSDSANVDFVTDDLAEFLARLNSHLLY
jgi:putative hydrolase of the HAD superfamily